MYCKESKLPYLKMAKLDFFGKIYNRSPFYVNARVKA